MEQGALNNAHPPASSSSPPTSLSTSHNASAPWLPSLAKMISAPLLPPSSVSQPSPAYINLAMVVINLANTTSLAEHFRNAVKKTVLSILLFTIDPINFIIVTDVRSLIPVSRFFGHLVAEQVAMRVIINPAWRWRKQKSLPNITFAFVDNQGIVGQRRGFVRALMEASEQAKDHKSVDQNKYAAELFYMAPLYHLAFTNLTNMVVIDATDLEFHDSLQILQGEMDQVAGGRLMGIAVDLSPNYYNYLEPYRRLHPSSRFGLPGRFQGFNTGVVLYNLEAMRASSVYNRQLDPGAVSQLLEEFMYSFTLAEQDWFTNLGFRHPELFHVLSCRFNRQTSIQFLKPPLEDIFEQFHSCGNKSEVLIYHGNGCGPRPADCKFNPANSTSKYWKEHNIYMEDIHFQFWRFWYDLVGLPPPPQ